MKNRVYKEKVCKKLNSSLRPHQGAENITKVPKPACDKTSWKFSFVILLAVICSPDTFPYEQYITRSVNLMYEDIRSILIVE
jgi:hypothetical protein